MAVRLHDRINVLDNRINGAQALAPEDRHAAVQGAADACVHTLNFNGERSALLSASLRAAFCHTAAKRAPFRPCRPVTAPSHAPALPQVGRSLSRSCQERWPRSSACYSWGERAPGPRLNPQQQLNMSSPLALAAGTSAAQPCSKAEPAARAGPFTTLRVPWPVLPCRPAGAGCRGGDPAHGCRPAEGAAQGRRNLASYATAGEAAERAQRLRRPACAQRRPQRASSCPRTNDVPPPAMLANMLSCPTLPLCRSGSSSRSLQAHGRAPCTSWPPSYAARPTACQCA